MFMFCSIIRRSIHFFLFLVSCLGVRLAPLFQNACISSRGVASAVIIFFGFRRQTLSWETWREMFGCGPDRQDIQRILQSMLFLLVSGRACAVKRFEEETMQSMWVAP